MVNSRKEANEDLKLALVHSSAPWIYNSEELGYYLTKLKLFLKNPDPDEKNILSNLKLFIFKILSSSFGKQENIEVIEFFIGVILSFLEWGKNITEGSLLDDLNYYTLQIFAKINMMIIGIDSFCLKFHLENKKFVKKNYSAWSGSSIKGNASLTMFLLNFFGKNGGFELFFKIALSNVCVEILLEFHMFDLLKHVNKPFLDTFIQKFTNLMKSKIQVLQGDRINEVNFQPFFKVCELCEEFSDMRSVQGIKMQFLEAAFSSGSHELITFALKKLLELAEQNKAIIDWVSQKKIIKTILERNNLELFTLFKPILLQMSSSLTSDQISIIYNSIKASQLSEEVPKYFSEVYRSLKKTEILNIFDLFSLDSNEEVLFATEFTNQVLDHFELTYQDYNSEYFLRLLSNENVTYHNFAIKVLIKLYHRFSISPKVSVDIIGHIKNIEKNRCIVQNIRILLDLDRSNVVFRQFLTEKSAKNAVSLIRLKENDPVYPERDKFQHLFKYLELYIKHTNNMDLQTFSDLYSNMKNTENEDIFAEWFERCIISFPPEINESIFTDYFLKISDYESLSFFSFKCFIKLFLLINSYDRCIEMKKGLFLVRLQKNLRNIEHLVEIALAANDRIFQNASLMLVNLNLKLGENLNKSRVIIWNDFFSSLLKKASEKNMIRVLTILNEFLNDANEKNHQSSLVLFLYKTIEESEFHEIYIEENSTIKQLKLKLAGKYKENYWNIVISCQDQKYERYENELKLKLLKNNELIICFSKEKSDFITIEEFFSQSTDIQDLLISCLKEEKLHSQLAYEILSSIPISKYLSCDFFLLEKPAEDLFRENLFCFSFQMKIIGNYLDDENWVKRFFSSGGVAQVLKTFTKYYYEDLGLNKSYLAVCLCFIRAFPDTLSKEVLKRMLFALSRIALCELEIDDEISEVLGIIKEARTELLEELYEDKVFFQDFWKNISILSKNFLVSVQIMKLFYEISEKNSKILNLTLGNIIMLLNDGVANEKFPNEFYIYLGKYLRLSNSHTLYLEITLKLKEALETSNRSMVSGLFYVLQSEVFTPTIEYTEKILEIYLNPEKPFILSKNSRTNFFHFLKNLFTQLPENNQSKLLHFFNIQRLSLENPCLGLTTLLPIGEFDCLKLQKSPQTPSLIPIIQQFFFQPSFKESLKSASFPIDSFSNSLQKVFKKLEKYFRSSIDLSSCFEGIREMPELSASENFCVFSKSLIKVLAKDFLSISKELPMCGKILVDNHMSKGCEHAKNKEEKLFSFLEINAKYRHLSEGLYNIFKPETSQVSCLKCGSVNYFQSRKSISEIPGLLVILISRFETENSKQIIFNRTFFEFPQEIDLKRYALPEFATNSKYLLSGVVSYDYSLNDFTSYSKVSGSWLRMKGGSIKNLQDKKYFTKLFGVSSGQDVKSNSRAACLLIYQKSQVLQAERLSVIPKSYLYDFFLLTPEFFDFILLATKKNLHENLRVSYVYFFNIVNLLDDYENLLIFSEVLLGKIDSDDMRNSEILLDVLQSFYITQVLTNVKNKLNSQILTDMVITAVIKSRPSANVRLLNYMLDQISLLYSLKNNSFFQIIYKICKIIPTLAIDEQAAFKVFQSVKVFFNKRQIPGYLISTFMLFHETFSEEEFRFLTDSLVQNLFINAQHDYVTALELGKMMALVEEDIICVVYLTTLIDIISGTPNIFHLLQVLGFLLFMKNTQILKDTFKRLKKIIKAKDSNDYQGVITEILFLCIIKNESVLEYLKSEKGILKILEQKMKFVKEEKLKISNIGTDKMVDILSAIKEKSKIPLNSFSAENILKTPFEPMVFGERVLEVNQTIYFKIKGKYKFFNFDTGRT